MGTTSLYVRWERLIPQLARVYGADLIRRFAQDEARSSTLRYLDWLRHRPPSSNEHRVLRAFVEGPAAAFLDVSGNGSVDSAAHERAFFDAVQSWHQHWIANPNGMSLVTIKGYIRQAAVAFDRLAADVAGIPPNFKGRSVRVPSPARSQTKSLGDLPWPELEGLHGAQRQREALRVARRECCRIFEEEEAAFYRGRQILRGEIPAGAHPDACAKIRPVLEYAEGVFRTTGGLVRASLTLDPNLRDNPGLDVEAWREAGFSIPPRTAVLHGPLLAVFVPTRRLTAAALAIVISDTGWNLQPTLDLPRDPFLFRSAEQAFMATPQFMESFKKRAGHTVLAYLDIEAPLESTRLNRAEGLWKETAEKDQSEADPQCAILNLEADGDGPHTMEIMERYRKMADVSLAYLDALPMAEQLRQHYWVVSSNSGLIKVYRVNAPSDMKLERKGIDYKTIRATVQMIRFEESGSVRAVSLSAGHRSRGVVMPHYLNAPHIAAQLDRNVRDYQDAMQGLVTRKLDQKVVARLLGLSEASLDRMRQHAVRAGISGSLGLVEDQTPAPGSPVVFEFQTPTDASLRDLYLTHRSLQQLRLRTTNHARYKLRYLPMLAIAKAYGLELLNAGYRPRYVRAARAAATELRQGRVSLPFLGE